MPEGKVGYTPEQLENEKSRTISDAELLEEGAEYIEKGRLELTQDQLEKMTPEGLFLHLAKRGRTSWESDVENDLVFFGSYEKVAQYWSDRGIDTGEVIVALDKAELPSEQKYTLAAEAHRKAAAHMEKLMENDEIPDVEKEWYPESIKRHRDIAEILSGKS